MVKKFALVISFLLIDMFGASLHYSLHKKNTNEGSTLLVIGGIHGNEPGGYFAPSVLLNHYKINSGNLWIVPNLNFDSIIKNERGIYGDMNRKFAKVESKDQDFKIVNEIKGLMLDKDVDLILNLHDGYGFYREKKIDGLYNPKAWGQAYIIDQDAIKDAKYGDLAGIAKRVSKLASIDLAEDVHEFNIKNTETKDKDVSMQQTLTYFAIQNNKPAFAVETSKNIKDLDLKVMYQLRSIEEFMDIVGIKFQRDFDLNRENIKKILSDYGVLEIPKGHIALTLNDLKPIVTNFPMESKLEYESKNPLIAVVKDGAMYKVMNGNILVTKLAPAIYEFDQTLEYVDFIIDGDKKTKKLGSIIDIKNDFEVVNKDGYRVNIIGYSSSNNIESGIKVTQNELVKKFAIDNKNNIFRVEFYKDKKFCGMVLARFVK